MNNVMTPMDLLNEKVQQSDPKFIQKSESIALLQQQWRADYQQVLAEMNAVPVGDVETMKDIMTQLQNFQVEITRTDYAIING